LVIYKDHTRMHGQQNIKKPTEPRCCRPALPPSLAPQNQVM